MFQSNALKYNYVQMYDVGTGLWSLKNPFPENMQDAMGITINNQAYVGL